MCQLLTMSISELFLIDTGVDRSGFTWTSSFPKYTYTCPYGFDVGRHIHRMSLFNDTSLTQIEPNTLFVTSRTHNSNFEFVNELELKSDNDPEEIDLEGILSYTFSLIDPSTVPNIEEIKTNSDPDLSTQKPLIMAYPHHDPKFYFKAGIEGYDDKILYVWYNLEESAYTERPRFIRSNTNTLTH
jgi:hypothetical protein